MPGPRNRPRKPKKGKKGAGKLSATAPQPKHANETEPETGSGIDTDLLRPEPDLVPPLGGKLHQGIKNYLNPTGNGPVLSGVLDFIDTSFADPPALADVRYAPFARHDVLDVLRLYLPEELALIVWYNKSRKEGRICAACRRFYRLGDTLPSLGPGDVVTDELDPRCFQERRISGLCTWLCFGVAAYNTPGVGRAWGRMESQLDAEIAWAINNPPPPVADDEGMGTLFRLTRRADVGLGHYIDLLYSNTTDVI